MKISEDNSNPAPRHQTEDAVLTTPEGHALPRVLDPSVTLDLVQRYVESERVKSRRALVIAGGLFLFVVLVLLAAFLSIGIYVLQNSRRAAQMAADLQSQSVGYAVEMMSISNKVDSLARGQKEENQKFESRRTKEGQVLKSDLDRFSQWIATIDHKQTGDLAGMETRLQDIEESSAVTEKDLATIKEQYEALLGRLSRASEGRMAEPPSPAVPAGDRKQEATGESSRAIGEAAATPTNREVTGAEPVSEPQVTQRVVSVVTLPNGDRYEGEFSDGLMNGWGIYYYRNGDKYEGGFQNDMKKGKGTFVYRNGDQYAGEFGDDVKSGKGSYVFGNGDKYVGDFANDMINGKGVMLYQDGSKYTGAFKNGLRDGTGILHFANGDVYEGDFKEDIREGSGTYAFSDGTKYIGEFRNGQRHGKGRYVYHAGEEYVGEFRNGKKEGEGVCIYPDGKRLHGQWKEDKLVKILDG